MPRNAAKVASISDVKPFFRIMISSEFIAFMRKYLCKTFLELKFLGCSSCSALHFLPILLFAPILNCLYIQLMKKIFLLLYFVIYDVVTFFNISLLYLLMCSEMY